MKSKTLTFTYQTRFSCDENMSRILDTYAELMSRVERRLFADIAAGKSSSELKSSYLVTFGITARQFNAMRVQLEGKIASLKELLPVRIEEISSHIKNLEKKICKIKSKSAVHQKKRSLASLKRKLSTLVADQDKNKVRICFGSKKLFRAQFALEENGYTSHEQWLSIWRQERNDSFFCLGSKDETAGNQSCSATLQEDGSLLLRLRLPDSLNQGKYLEIPNITFSYGQETILAALQSCKDRVSLTKQKDPNYIDHGQALSYRFKRDKKGWRVFVSTEQKEPKWITNKELGAIGVDINADHLAIVETDRFGNPIAHKSIPLVTYGKKSDQTLAIIGDAAAEIVEWSVRTKKTIVLEKLDFTAKKTELAETKAPRYARMLSSFSYSSIIGNIKSRAYRFAIKVEEVNPAFTSVIGRVKFASRYGLTIHEAAALAIARRFQETSERVPRRLDKIPDGKCGHVTLPLPARNQGKHVWTQWRQIRKKLPVALAAHFRATKVDPLSRRKSTY